MKNTRIRLFQFWTIAAFVLWFSMPVFSDDVQPADYGTFEQFTSSPDNARGLYQMFYFTFENVYGVDSISKMKILFGANKDDRTGVYVEVNREGRVRVGDNGRFSFYPGDGHLGENKVIETSRVIVDLQRSRMSQVGSDTLVIGLFLDFRDKDISGRKRIFLAGSDIQNLDSEFFQRGGFTIADSESRHTPEWISMNPDNEEGRSQLFTFIVEDKDGADDINRIYIRYSKYKNTTYGRLGFTIIPSTKEIRMDGGGRDQSGDFGDNRKLKSYAGTLDLSESSIGIDRLGDRYIVKLKLMFGNSNVGEKKFWGEAIDLAGNSSGEKELGKYTVSYSKVAPHPLFMLPGTTRTPARSAQQGQAMQVFSFWWRDSDGLDDIKTLRVKFAADSRENDEKVEVSYSLVRLDLVKGTDRIYGFTGYGGSGRVESDNAVLYSRDSHVTRIDDYTARIDIGLTFTNAFAGSWNVYLRGEDFSGNQKAWRRLGKLEVTTGSSRPTGKRILPFFSTSLKETYLFEFSDPDGPGDIDWAEAEFKHAGDDGTYRDSFLIRYTQGDNKIRLFYASRLYTGMPGENKTIGADGVQIDLRKSFVIYYKDRLQLFVAIEFDNAFIWGLKNILLWTKDYADNESRRRIFGGINIPVDR